MEATIDVPAKRSRASHDPTLREEVKALYISGVLPSRITILKSVPTMTVQTWAKRFGWTKLRDNVSEHVNKAIVTSVTDSVQRKTEELKSTVVNELEASVNTLRATKHAKTLDHVGQRMGVIERAAAAGKSLGLWGHDSDARFIGLAILSGGSAQVGEVPGAIDVESSAQQQAPDKPQNE